MACLWLTDSCVHVAPKRASTMCAWTWPPPPGPGTWSAVDACVPFRPITPALAVQVWLHCKYGRAARAGSSVWPSGVLLPVTNCPASCAPCLQIVSGWVIHDCMRYSHWRITSSSWLTGRKPVKTPCKHWIFLVGALIVTGYWCPHTSGPELWRIRPRVNDSVPVAKLTGWIVQKTIRVERRWWGRIMNITKWWQTLSQGKIRQEPAIEIENRIMEETGMRSVLCS